MTYLELKWITGFVKESNLIERIQREPTPEEIEEFTSFLSLDRVYVENLVDFVRIYQPNARLRNLPHLNARVSAHIAPQGGHLVVSELTNLLDDLVLGKTSSYKLHQRYEHLHPFTDGNGRSGRALWAWQEYKMYGPPGLSLKFLQKWYYQSLDEYRL